MYVLSHDIDCWCWKIVGENPSEFHIGGTKVPSRFSSPSLAQANLIDLEYQVPPLPPIESYQNICVIPGRRHGLLSGMISLTHVSVYNTNVCLV